MKVALGIWLAVLVVTVVASGYLDGCLAEEVVERPEAATFDLVRLDGVPVRFEEQRGRVLILDFWATWCAPCEVQMPILQEIWERRGGEPLTIVGVSMDTDPPDAVSRWLAERDLTYPIAIADQQLAVDYGVWSFPTLVVVDSSGRIARSHLGVLSRPELDDLIDQLQREIPSGG